MNKRIFVIAILSVSSALAQPSRPGDEANEHAGCWIELLTSTRPDSFIVVPHGCPSRDWWIVVRDERGTVIKNGHEWWAEGTHFGWGGRLASGLTGTYVVEVHTTGGGDPQTHVVKR